MSTYGRLPHQVGTVDAPTDEMMYWLYCPVKLPGQEFPTLPDTLEQYRSFLEVIRHDANRLGAWLHRYVYFTVKTLWVSPDTANRPGWHCDGFMTPDINYIWYDSVPTVFYHDGREYNLTQDHSVSMQEMHDICEFKPDSWYYRYPTKTLLRLNETMMHKTEPHFEPQKRTFIKVSLSPHEYALRGNSINHKLELDWEYQNRKVERNCPITARDV